MEVIDLILPIIFLHFIADFVCQSNWMAQNKSKDMIALSTHVIVYTCVISAGMVVILGTSYPLFQWCMINGILHFCVDFITSRVSSMMWEQKRVHAFFVVIGFDQLLHYFSLILTLRLLA